MNNFLLKIFERLYEWMPFKYWTSGVNSIVQSNSGCEAKNDNEVALGQYNSSTQSTSPEEATIFSIGIGQDNSNRSNALEIKKSGDIFISKDGNKINLQETLDSVENIESIPTEEIEDLKNNYLN